jgi:hypothetical protein
MEVEAVIAVKLVAEARLLQLGDAALRVVGQGLLVDRGQWVIQVETGVTATLPVSIES